MSLKRIKREILDLSKEDLGEITLTPSERSMYKWTGSIPGPTGSPYEGGVFKVAIELAGDYREFLVVFRIDPGRRWLMSSHASLVWVCKQALMLTEARNIYSLLRPQSAIYDASLSPKCLLSGIHLRRRSQERMESRVEPIQGHAVIEQFVDRSEP